jgi:hypothetical protein
MIELVTPPTPVDCPVATILESIAELSLEVPGRSLIEKSIFRLIRGGGLFARPIRLLRLWAASLRRGPDRFLDR